MSQRRAALSPCSAWLIAFCTILVQLSAVTHAAIARRYFSSVLCFGLPGPGGPPFLNGMFLACLYAVFRRYRDTKYPLRILLLHQEQSADVLPIYRQSHLTTVAVPIQRDS